MRVSTSPSEADAPLIVDADTVLTGTRSFELLESIAGRYPEVFQALRGIYKDELSQHDALEIRPKATRRLTSKQTCRVAIGEAPNHPQILTRRVIIRKNSSRRRHFEKCVAINPSRSCLDRRTLEGLVGPRERRRSCPSANELRQHPHPMTRQSRADCHDRFAREPHAWHRASDTA